MTPMPRFACWWIAVLAVGGALVLAMRSVEWVQ